MPDQTDEILTQATGARENSEKLLPLLDLLNENSGETSPLDELKGLLQAIVEILKRQNESLSRLESACATVQPRNS